MAENEAIAVLQQQMAQLMEEMGRMATKQQAIDDNNDPHLAPPIITRVFTASEREAEFYPELAPPEPASFYNESSDEEELQERFRRFPKNSAMDYEPPTTPAITLKKYTQEERTQDNNLRSLQRRLVQGTRAIDDFLHKIWLIQEDGGSDPELLKASASFAILMRQQQASLASQINRLRKEKALSTHNAALKHGKRDFYSPSELSDNIKTNQSVIKTVNGKPYSARSDNTSSHKSSSNGARHRFRDDDYSFHRGRQPRRGDHKQGRSRSRHRNSHHNGKRRPSKRESEDDSHSS
ncbi:hypothetical protein BGZ73_004217 [Actinomortierella ambigua]|nr:hypothetical protein BGZ73_004217 [Actinomortierella ambigua]